ncbi:odr-4 protein [Phytophthora cinnamomi]|uniref:odr-4 protein n=1 Tax=Phytophthora cinnamomi TaxID=4785 RepID=UPI003559C793|nr:odr-4 protein [Phytophthora cinnamomi]
MGNPRQVIVDDQVAAFWSSNAQDAFDLGLLVGQVSTSNVGDSVLAVVPVPSESETGEAPTGLSDVSVDWVQEVAQQVDRLLPGGITVLGLYVVSARDVSTQLVPYLRATAEAMALPSNVNVGDNVHYLALVSPNGEVAFQSFYDVADVKKTQMLPAERKTPTTDIKFKQYRTLIDLDEPTPFVNVAPNAAMAATEVAETRMNEVEKQLKPFFRRVEDSIAVLKLTGDTVAQHMNLLTLTPPESKQFVEDPLGGIHGSISCVAFVSQSEPEANEVAANYLKRDFVKSLLVRVALARERWAEDDEVEPNAVFQEGGTIRLAQRGLVPWRSAAALSPHFSATIHVFPDEDVIMAVKNALEILGGSSDNNAAGWAAMEIGGQLGSPMDLTFGVTESEHFKYVYYLVPVILVLILLVAQYIM